MHAVTGQLTFRRAVSKRLVFYDLRSGGGGSSGASAEEASGGEAAPAARNTCQAAAEAEWVEVVVKQGAFGGAEEIRQLRSALKLGDVVRAEGTYIPHAGGGGGELLATAVTVLLPWRDSHPSQGFSPQPAPIHARAERREQQEQEQQENGAAAVPDGTAAAAAAEAAAVEGAAVEGAAAAAAATAYAGAALGASARTARPALCKYWLNSGRCTKGDACPFAHARSAALQQRWVDDMRSERQALSSLHGFAHSGGAEAKSRRSQVLAAWLVDTFGAAALNSGEGVLDVAGGAGGLTFELAHAHSVRSTLVDPRPLKLSKRQRQQLAAAGRAPSIHTVTAEELQQPEQPPAAATAAAELAAAEGTADADTAAAAGAAFKLRQVRAWFGPELWRSAGWRRRFGRRFSLVLACHPDQATDHALDYALEAGLPFVIVPCCVFPRLFPHRRLPPPPSTGDDPGSAADGGAPVESYSDLVRYLAARGGAQTAVLGFQGANTAVYRTAAAPSAAAVAHDAGGG